MSCSVRAFITQPRIKVQDSESRENVVFKVRVANEAGVPELLGNLYVTSSLYCGFNRSIYWTLTFHTLFCTGNTYVTVTGVHQFTDLRFESPGSGYTLAFFLFDTSDVSVRDEESIDIIIYNDAFGVGPAYSQMQINTRPKDMARRSQPKP